MTKTQQRIFLHIQNNPIALITADLTSNYKKDIIIVSNFVLQERDHPNRILILSSKKEIELGWLPSIHQIQDYQNIQFIVALGKPKRKQYSIFRKRSIVLTNYESLDWIKDMYLSGDNVIIIDGISGFRNRKTKRYKDVKNLVSKANRIIGISHLLFPDELSDIWDEIYLLDNGIRLGLTKNAFLDRYFFTIRENRDKYIKPKYIPKDNAQNAIYKAIEKNCLDITKFYCHIRNKNLYIDLSKGELSRYQLVKKYNVSEEKLLQLAGGIIYDENKTPVLFHSRKITVLKELMKFYQNKEVLIVCNYKHEMNVIIQEIPFATSLDNKEFIEDWNKKNINLGVINSSVFGNKRDMFRQGDVIIWYSPVLSKKIYEKINKRLAKEKESMIINLIALKTIDEEIIQTLTNG